MSGHEQEKKTWATLTDEALRDEIRRNRRTERRLLVTVVLVAAACTAVMIVLHGLAS